jgi:hypothetical protein
MVATAGLDLVGQARPPDRQAPPGRQARPRTASPPPDRQPAPGARASPPTVRSPYRGAAGRGPPGDEL